MFIFKEVTSDEMSVICNNENVFETTPDVNFEESLVDGMDGAIYYDYNNKPVKVTAKMTLTDLDLLDTFKAWLRGTGTLVYKDRYKTARFYTNMQFDRFGYNSMETSVSIILDPYWYRDIDYIDVDDLIIINIGNVEAKPIIKLVKTTADYIDLTVNGTRFKYTFGDDDEVEIDCLNMTETNSLNIEIDYQYPSLKVGKNTVTINDGTASIYVKRKDRWI